MTKELTLYSFADVDRSGKVRWAACELGYSVKEERLKPGQHLGPEYLGVNPYAQIPAARIDGEVMVESTAICIALAERHPESGLIPEARGERDSFWQAACVATQSLEMPVVAYYLAKIGIVDAGWAPLLEKPLPPRLRTFAGQVPAEGWWLGEFTLLDIFAAYVLRIGISADLLKMDGALGAYLERLMARPAAQQARFFDSLKERAPV